jgi:hypothetical protein
MELGFLYAVELFARRLETNVVERIVFKQPLALHSAKPMTGFTRSGYCEVPKEDGGNHSVAGTFALSTTPRISPFQFLLELAFARY